MLEDAGLRPDEEQAYRTLVKLARAVAGDLAHQLGVSEREAQRLLDALAAAGLAAPTGGGGDRDDDGGGGADRHGGGPGSRSGPRSPCPSGSAYRPLPPDVALGTALLRRQESLEAARRMVAQLTEEYRATVRRHDADRLVEIVTGREDLRQRLRHLQDTAQQEVLWFCRANHVAMASTENSEEFSALRRGVSYRVIYERALLEEPGMIENVAEGIRCGEQARSLPVLPVRLAIADQSVAICPLVPDGRSGEPTAAVVGRSQLLDALLALFDSSWDRASPVALTPGTAGAGAAVDQPDASERLLLSLFVAGLPDKAIASQLTVSRRTVQRRLADLMARAGVDTRPGLAFQAARRGWV